jgi:YD repeat-containing protein
MAGQGACNRITGKWPLVTGFTYDAAGNVRTVTDPKLHVTTYTYDGLSRLTSVQQDLGQTVSYAYDGRGRLEKVSNARGDHLVSTSTTPGAGSSPCSTTTTRTARSTRGRPASTALT